MKLTLIGAAASVALVSATTIALAQGGVESPGKMQGPGMQGPGSQGPGMQGPGTHGPGMQGPGTHGPGAQAPATRQPDSKAEGRAPGKGEAQRAPDATPGKGMKESQGTQRKEQPKSTERQPEKGHPKATEHGPEKGQAKATERAPEKAQPKATERRPDGNQSAQGRSQGRVQVSEEQRGGVRERLLKDGKVQRTRLNISLNIGTRVPRSVRLLALPVAIIEFAPAYRGYNYVVLEDETICIVDPRSYEIVDVIPAGTQRAERSHGPALSLSQEQMRFISANVPRERTADIRVRLALGAEVPRDVELLSFPRAVTSHVPEIEAFRYVVTENDVVVVDPHDRAVTLVITE